MFTITFYFVIIPIINYRKDGIPMKLCKYFRQLKRLIVLPTQFKFEGIKKSYYYSYHRKIFLKFLIYGLFKNEIQIKFGSDYWKLVPKYLFLKIPSYFHAFVNYKFDMFYYNKIKHKNVQFPKPLKPLSPKFRQNHLFVNEFILEDVVKTAGFEIVFEELGSLKTVFTISFQ